jgi:alpha-tubulin suppressor-like RCC1 family protein
LTVTLTPLNYLYAWGFSGSGELGLNNTIYRSSPTQVGASGTWLNLAGYGDYGGSSLASKTDGTLWAWGSNTLGRLGLPISTSGATSSPTQVGTDTTWTGALTSSDRASFAIKTDGTLWSWGNAGLGQLGQGNRVYRSSPVQVGTGTDWNNVVIGNQSMIASKTNGTLWAWGANNQGQLGRNNTVYVSSPVQVGGNTNWSQLAVAYSNMAAIKTDGTIWIWGNQIFGSHGLNDASAVRRSSPTQIGTGTNWSKIHGLGGGWLTTRNS